MIYSKSDSSIKIEDYIDSNIIKKVLSCQLGAVDISELERNDGLKKLIEFVQETFKVHFNGRDNKVLRKLEYITRDLRIPSRSGRNIANV